MPFGAIGKIFEALADAAAATKAFVTLIARHSGKKKTFLEELKEISDLCWIAFKPDTSLATIIPEFPTARYEKLLEDGFTRFVLDLRDVATMDSACLGEVLACHKQAVDVQGRIHIVLKRDGRIHEFFATTHLDRVFSLYEEVDSAVEAFDG